jgi:hypothetical protein
MLLVLVNVSSQLDLPVKISLHLVDHQTSYALLVDRLPCPPLKLRDLFGLVRVVILFFPPLVGFACLG